MKTKKRGSFFGGLLTFVLLVVIAATVASNLIFSGERLPKITDYYLYLQDSDEMEADSPEESIPAHSLVLAKSAATTDLHVGNKVLCYLADGTLASRVIYKIEETDDGTVNYYPGTAKEQGSELVIPRTNIFAICTWASPELYQYIRFATSVNGLMALLVAPCVILIIMLLVKIARNGTEDIDDDEFELEDDDTEEDTEEENVRTDLPKSRKPAPVYPLYDPNQAAAPEGLAEKKSSISENFTEKPVNENSPYQKAVQEQEKTTRFRREEIEAEALRALEEPAPRKKKSSTHVYPAEEIRTEAQTQQAQHFSEPSAPVQEVPVPAAPPEPVIQEAPASAPVPVAVPAPEPPQTEAPKPASKPSYRSTSPNIDDILKPSELRKSGKSNSDISRTDSIDDLIRALENEKKKL